MLFSVAPVKFSVDDTARGGRRLRNDDDAIRSEMPVRRRFDDLPDICRVIVVGIEASSPTNQRRRFVPKDEERRDERREEERTEGEWKKEPGNKSAEDDEWPVQISQHVKQPPPTRRR